MTKAHLLHILAWTGALNVSAMALECPTPGVVADPAQASVIENILPADVDLEAPDALQSAIFDLKQSGVADDVILDNLIATYCVYVDAEPGVSDDDKTQQVKDFSEAATQAVFGNAD